MYDPVAIESGTESIAFGAVGPDLPGCVPDGDTLEVAMAQAKHAVVAWMEAAINTSRDIAQPSRIDVMRQAHEACKGWSA